MGYYADGFGEITLKPWVSQLPEDVHEKLNYFEIYDKYRINGKAIISFGESDKYWDDSTKEALNAVVPYIDEGCVEYVGEDKTYWRFVFNPKTQKWDEEYGGVVYESDRRKIEVELPVGTLICEKATDHNYPGLFISLRPKGQGFAVDIAGADYDIDAANGLKLYVWEHGFSKFSSRDEVTRTFFFPTKEIEGSADI